MHSQSPKHTVILLFTARKIKRTFWAGLLFCQARMDATARDRDEWGQVGVTTAPRPSPTPSSRRVLANLVAHRENGSFPMIGKNCRSVFGKQKGQRGQRFKREEGLPDHYGNFRQLFSTLKSMKTASRTRNAWRADGERQLDNSGGKRMGNRVEAGGAGVPPATIPESENRPKTTCFP